MARARDLVNDIVPEMQANVRLVEMWADILRKNIEQGEAFVASAANKAK